MKAKCNRSVTLVAGLAALVAAPVLLAQPAQNERDKARVEAEARAAAERAAAEEARKQQEFRLQHPILRTPSSGQELFERAQGLERGGRHREAVQQYTRAARAGSGEAAKRLSEIYRDGLFGVAKDHAESLKWERVARLLERRAEPRDHGPRWYGREPYGGAPPGVDERSKSR